jgi:hypothetical protein
MMSFLSDESEGACQLVLEVICPDRNDPICGDTHVPVLVTVTIVGDATVDRRGSHHRHDSLPEQGGLKT